MRGSRSGERHDARAALKVAEPEPEPEGAAWPPVVRTVRLGPVDVRVATSGPQDGRALLLVNGIGANVEMWEPLARALHGRRLVMFDAPGTGRSGNPPGLPRFPELARFVVELLDVLELRQVDVLGYSWGGALAQQLARQSPERLHRVVLAATIPGLGGQPPPPWVVAAMLTPLRYWSPAYLRLVSPFIYGASVPEDATHASARRHRPPSLPGYLKQLYAVTGWTSRPWLKEIDVPVLVLAGRGDALAPVRNARILAHGIPRARLQVLPGGHLLLLQRPAAAAAAINVFLGLPD